MSPPLDGTGPPVLTPAPKAAAPTKRGKRRGFRLWLRRTLQVSSALVVLLSGVVFVLLRTQFGAQLAIEKAMPLVNQLFKGDIVIGSVEGEIATRLVLHDVRILDVHGREALFVERAEVEVGLLPLMGQRVELRDVLLVGVTYTLLGTDDHVLVADAFLPESPSAEPASSDPSPWVIDIQRLAIQSGRFVTAMGSAPTLSDLSGSLALLIERDVYTWTDLAITSAVSVVGVPVDQVTIASDGRFGPDDLSVQRLEIAIVGATLNLRAETIGPLATVWIDSGVVELAWLSAYLNQPLGQGDALISGRATWLEPRAEVALRVETPLGLATLRADASVLETVDARLELDVAGLRLEGFFDPGAEPAALGGDLAIRAHALDVMHLGAVDASVELTHPVGFLGYPTASLLAHVRGGQAEVSGRAAAFGQTIDLLASVDDLHAFDDLRAQVQVRAGRIELAALSPVLELPLATTLLDLRLAATVVLAEGQPRSAAVDLAFRLDAPSVPSIEGLSLGDGAVILNASAQFAPGRPMPALSSDLSIRLAHLGSEAAASGEASVLVSTRPTGLEHAVTVSVDVMDVRAGPARARHLHLDADGGVAWDGEGPVVPTRLMVRSKAERVEASGVSVERFSLELDGVPRDGAVEIGGPLSVSGVVAAGTATLGDLAGQIGISASGTSLASLTLPGAFTRPSALVDLRGKSLAIPGTAAIPWFTIVAEGSADPEAPAARLRVVLKSPVVRGQRLGSVVVVASMPTRRRADVSVRAESHREAVALDARISLPDQPEGEIGVRVSRLTASRDGLTITAEPGLKIRLAQELIAVKGLLLRVTRRRGDALEGRLRAEGSFRAQSGRVEGQLSADGFAVGPWVEFVQAFSGTKAGSTTVAGTLDALVTVNGTLRSPRIGGNVHLANGRFRTFKGVDLGACFVMEPGSTSAQFEARWQGQRVMAHGKVPLGVRIDGGPIRLPKDRTLPVAFSLDTENVDLKALAEALELSPLAGAVSIDAVVSGSIGKPRGSVTAVVTGLSGMGVRPVDVMAAFEADGESAKVSVTVDQGGDRVATAYLGAPVELVDGLMRGSSPVTLLNRLETKGRVELTRLKLGAILEEDLVTDFGEVEAEATLVMRGTLPQLEVTGELAARGVPAGEDRLDVSVGLDFEEGMTRIDGAVAEADESLVKLFGTIPGPLGAWLFGRDVTELLRDPSLMLTLELDGANPDALKALAPDVVRQLEDTFEHPVIRGRVIVTGTVKGPELVADAAVENGSGADPTALFDSATVMARIGPNQSVAEVTVTQTVLGRLPTGQPGVAPNVPGEALFVSVETALGTSYAFGGARRPLATIPLTGFVRSAGFDLGLLHTLVPKVLDRSPGKFYADLAITGTVGKPIMEGAVRVRFDRLRLLTIGLDQPNADLTLRLRKQQLTLWPKVVFVQDGRRFEIELGATFRSPTPSGIDLQGSLVFDRFPILRRQDIAMVLSGRVDLGGTLARPSLKGRLHVDDLQVRVLGGDRDVRPRGPPVEVIFVGRGVAPSASRKSETFAGLIGEKVELDLAIELPRRGARLRSDEIDVWAEGDLRVRTDASGVELLGRVIVNEGEVILYGRQFRLEPESAVIFDGGDAIDPALDLRAKFSLADVDLSGIGHINSPGNHILLSIGGRGSKPRLALSSVPALSETDIIAIVTVGGPTNDTTAGSNNTGKVGSALMGLVSSSASRMLQDRLPVDVFKVEAGADDLSEAKITVGKRLMSNLVLSYNANFGAQPGENRNEVGLQYEISRRLQLYTRYGDAGAGGIDMLYLWRF